MLTKEDYMKLSKERLAELLVERDNESKTQTAPIPIPQYPYQPDSTGNPPCWAPGGWCSNPFHDCVGCPKRFDSSGSWTNNFTKSNNNYETQSKQQEKQNLND